MSFWFWISVVGEILIFPLYIWSLEHTKLQKKYGTERGSKIGDILGLISGWGYFLFLFGIWLSPQPRFIIPLFSDWVFTIPVIEISIPSVHGIIFLVLIFPVLWMSLLGVKEVTLKVAETHRPNKVVTTGIYTHVRHPQYLGALLAHIAISFLFSALFSFLLTPLMIIYIFLLARKEETELIKEFGENYKKYMTQVPMFIPKIRF
jgi:protein-S-isoprenylcysteine O-methyltransferase Ste14